jgi:hypothetical protein
MVAVVTIVSFEFPYEVRIDFDILKKHGTRIIYRNFRRFETILKRGGFSLGGYLNQINA